MRLNFRRLNQDSCLTCDHKAIDDCKNICILDGERIGDDQEDRSQMSMEFVCDDFRQRDWAKEFNEGRV